MSVCYRERGRVAEVQKGVSEAGEPQCTGIADSLTHTLVATGEREGRAVFVLYTIFLSLSVCLSLSTHFPGGAETKPHEFSKCVPTTWIYY